MREKRIAIITPYSAEPRFDNYADFILAQTLTERGIPLRLYTYAVSDPVYGHDLTYQGVEVLRSRHRFGFSPRLFFSLLWYRPAVVVCFHPKNLLNLSAYLAARLIGARLVVEIVGILHDPYIVTNVDDPQKLKSPIRLVTSVTLLLKEFFAGRIRGLWTNFICHMPTAHADTLIAINDDERGLIKKIYGRDSVRIYWCTPRAINPEQNKPAGDIPDHFLFFIGQIKRRKGWDTAIDTIAALKRMGVEKKLVFVSPKPDDGEAEARARSLGVSENITFLSAISNEEKNWLYAHSDAVLVPSTYEGFGIPVFEAFLLGAPVIASNIPVFLEFLKDRENALICNRGDRESFARAVIDLAQDRALRSTIVAGGASTAKQFNYQQMVDAYTAVLEK